MPRYIVKLEDYYLEWSTVVDAPVTYGMPLEEFQEYYEKEYGRDGLRELGQRLRRTEETGCSAHSMTADDLLECNHAGEDGKRISKDEIIKKYCHDRGKDDYHC